MILSVHRISTFGFTLLLVSNSNGSSPYVVPTNYSKRESYPDYCSTPKAMKKRKIYPVKDASGLRIIQVAAFIRHGARTPWGRKFFEGVVISCSYAFC